MRVRKLESERCVRCSGNCSEWARAPYNHPLASGGVYWRVRCWTTTYRRAPRCWWRRWWCAPSTWSGRCSGSRASPRAVCACSSTRNFCRRSSTIDFSTRYSPARPPARGQVTASQLPAVGSGGGSRNWCSGTIPFLFSLFVFVRTLPSLPCRKAAPLNPAMELGVLHVNFPCRPT